MYGQQKYFDQRGLDQAIEARIVAFPPPGAVGWGDNVNYGIYADFNFGTPQTETVRFVLVPLRLNPFWVSLPQPEMNESVEASDAEIKKEDCPAGVAIATAGQQSAIREYFASFGTREADILVALAQEEDTLLTIPARTVSTAGKGPTL